MPSATRSLILPGVLTVLGLIVLIGLGTWQLLRLAEKEQQTAQIEASLTVAPVPLPSHTEWATLKPADYDYRRVSLTGTFQHDKEALAFGFISVGVRGDTREGFFALTPFVLEDGSTVIVNRGFVPQELRAQSSRAPGLIQGAITLTGLMRVPEKKGTFTPEDEPAKNIFFTIDPLSIARARQIEQVAPFIVDADKSQVPGQWPEGGHTIVALANNHLQYAITWFALALGLMGVFFVFANNRLKQDR
jgi:surfeit locus 1 family protein